MGTQEMDWIAVANNLLSRCHINRQVRDLAQCDAGVFVALYEAILGEKVPDFIAKPASQEDDAHNMQSVIDSLALDYLQVSLSHITGENIVRGDPESIRNLLEIFDGLLEYLAEQISEVSSQNGDDGDSRDQYDRRKDELPPLRPPPSPGSSEPIAPSWEVDGSESTGELIRLGDTAHTFIQRGGLSMNGFSLHDQSQEVTPSAIPLRPPYQPKDSRPVPIRQDIPGSESSDRAAERPLRRGESTATARGAPRKSKTSTEGFPSMNGFSLHDQSQEDSAILLRPPYQPKDRRPVTSSRDIPGSESSDRASGSPVRSREPTTTPRGTADRTTALHEDLPSEKSLESSPPSSPDRRSPKHAGRVSSNEVPTQLAQKKVAFRTQPDIRFMTLQRTLEDQSDWTPPSDGGESDRDPALDSGFSLLDSRASDLSLADEPLSVQRARNKSSEMELQEMSEKLSRRLDELDQMLKKALGERDQSSELKDEDKLSQHSDSIMEFRRKKRLQAAQNHKKPSTRHRSLSSSPVPLPTPRPLPCAQFEDALHKEARGEMGKIRREVQKELDLQRLKAQMLNAAYKEELKDFEKTEKVKLSKLQEKINQKDQEYKENIYKEPEKRSHPEKVYAGKQTRPRHWTPSCHKAAGRMKIKENDLLPLLLEEFPHLQISPHTFNAMWKGQLAQVDQLARSAQEDERSERKLQREVEEAHKRHGLLTEIIRREQGHNQRLKDFKERIRLQKTSQNKMKENRQQVTRAKKYYEDYHVQLGAKLMRARTREEKIMKNLFEEGLEIQKQRLRELRSYTKEQREEQGKRHKDELESMENYYKDQFSMLAEAVTQEKQEMQTQEKAQSKNLQKMKKELRQKMEKEIQELQEMILRADEDVFFRELEAERLKRRLQMASFQYGKSHCL
ncbi:centrosomal protein of 95 kDa isoform X2 [Rana temporaria]|uniref:centrosomal protein of 95 kDa isoform X2 n=1 Tax=Rana temporaria TaxID=8407 RepID=UPI001AAC6BFA|nr:centrosomal protein of 95 kDa isoform X2 [Rana temporaria]